MRRVSFFLLVGGLLSAVVSCDGAGAQVGPDRGPGAATTAGSASPSLPAVASTATTARSTTAPRAAPPPVDTAAYPWHGDDSIDALPAVDSLQGRYPAPDGFERVELASDSFGAWLRGLPLAAPATPVRAHDGKQLYDLDDPRIAAVSTLDVGSRDLQQCADVVMRLHAEWRWHLGQVDDLAYPSGGGPIPWSRYLRGETPVVVGNSFRWRGGRPRQPIHAQFRRYLDQVFSWANTVSLARHATKPAPDEVRPGDFFVLPGSPGHTVLLLDIARAPDGRTVALIGQSYMPAQSFQVLRAASGRVWFELDAGRDVATPFWRPFPWTALRRL